MQNQYVIPLKPDDVSWATTDLGTPISPRAAQGAINAGRIGFVKIGRARYTSMADLLTFIESCRVEPKVNV